MKQLKYKLLHKNATAPNRAHDDDTGFDLTTAWIEVISEHTVKLHMGVAVEPPAGYYFDLRPRSSFAKTGWVCGNSLGTIDKGYRGELMAVVHRVTPDASDLCVGDRHFQLVLQKYENDDIILEAVNEFDATERGEGGFGSTGR